MNQNIIRAIIRTLVPVIAGQLIAFGLGDVVDPEGLEGFVDTGLTAAYYISFKLLEGVDSRFGYFLGMPGAPSYDAGVSPVLAEGLDPVDFIGED